MPVPQIIQPNLTQSQFLYALSEVMVYKGLIKRAARSIRKNKITAAKIDLFIFPNALSDSSGKAEGLRY